jgi:hypothetical protein
MNGSPAADERHLLTARLGLASLVFITVAGVLSPASKLLIVLVPALSFFLALYLHRRLPGYYVALVCWLYFLIPLLRRLIEFRTESTKASLVMVSPFLACLAGLAIFRSGFSQILSSRLRTWLYVAAAVFYGALVGLLLNPLIAVVQDIFGWVSPICFGLYIYAQREHGRELLGSLRSSFLYGTLVMALYGLYQFFFLAPWDAFWMENSGLTSIGAPEPMLVRVFSTMNSPQTLADFLIGGVLLSIASPQRIRFLIMPLGLLAVGLTNSRSAWVCGLLAMVIMSVSFTPRQRMQMVVLLLVCVALVGVAFQVPEVNEMLTRRLETFSNLREDGSVNDRVASQQQAIAAFQSSPFGLGLGSDAHSKNDGPSYGVPPQSIEIGDNGIEQVLLSFGWCGSIIFFMGFGGAVFACLRTSRDTELRALKALLIGMIFQIPVMGVFPGASGFLMWSAIGFCSSWKGSAPESPSRSSLAMEEWTPGLVRET